jgi:hypothetical protein
MCSMTQALLIVLALEIDCDKLYVCHALWMLSATSVEIADH